RSRGAITLVSGSPDLPGDLTLNGRAHAIGRSTLPNAFGTADLDGCTVHIASTGIVDTTGDQQAHNTLTARKALVVDSGAQIKTTGGSSASRNFLILPTGSTPPTTGTFSPPLAPSDETFLRPCTAPAQTGCLTPCPVCPNHVHVNVLHRRRHYLRHHHAHEHHHQPDDNQLHQHVHDVDQQHDDHDRDHDDHHVGGPVRRRRHGMCPRHEESPQVRRLDRQ